MATGSDRGGRSWLVPPLLLAVLGGWLVARGHGFWYDELYTAEVAPLPLARLLDALLSGEGTIPYLADAPPSYNAPYYAVAHVWLKLTGLGPDEVGLRLLSLVSAVAAVAVFTRAVRRLAGPRVAVVAGLVLAANPFVVRYAGEARGYALALLATALAVLGLARWLGSTPERPLVDRDPHDGPDRPEVVGRGRDLLLFGVAGAAAGLAHWFAVLVPLALAVAAVVLRGRRAVPVVAVAVAAASPALGLVAVAVANGVGGSGAEWIADVGLAVPWLTLRAWTGSNPVLLVATAATVAVAVRTARRDRGPLVVAGLWAALPVAAVTALEILRPVFVARYLLAAAAGLAVLVAIGITALPRRASAAALMVVVGASTWATVGGARSGPLEDGRGAVAAVAARHRPGEPVVAAARWDALSLDHYARRDHAALVPDLVLPPAPVPAAPRVWVVRRGRPGVKGDPDKLAALDADLAGRGLRVAEELRLDGRSADVVVQRWE